MDNKFDGGGFKGTWVCTGSNADILRSIGSLLVFLTFI